MIQRIQSIYLGMVCVITGGFINLPIYYADGNPILPYQNIVLSIVVAITALLAIGTIFLYKNRKLQMKLTWVGMILGLSMILLSIGDYLSFITKTTLGKNISYGFIFPIAIIFLFFMAWRGISKDEKLVRSMDRLR
ncbi:MAG: DUF4293 domain-containing protein [Bacteroidota bacterium]